MAAEIDGILPGLDYYLDVELDVYFFFFWLRTYYLYYFSNIVTVRGHPPEFARGGELRLRPSVMPGRLSAQHC